MRQLTALFMALTVSASAQTKIGVVEAPGLNGMPLAPVPGLATPGLSLSPATLSPAALTPSLAAPSFVPSPADMAPVALTPATAVQAASTPDEKASPAEQAEAAKALFDGVGRLSAPATGDEVPGTQSDPNRASGLSPPSAGDLTAAFRKAAPKSKAVDVFGGDFVAAAGDIVMKYTFMGDHFLESMPSRGMMDFRGKAINKAVEDLVAMHDARSNPAAREFMRLLGAYGAHISAREAELGERLARLTRRAGPKHMPPSPIPGGEYWDMAAGMNAERFIRQELKPGINYSFFDYSPFVVSYLETAAKLAKADNAKIVEGDIGQLKKPAKPIAVLRTKNTIHYVPGFGKKLEEMVDWIVPGGQLVIQNDPNPGQRTQITQGHGELIRRLLAEGWAIEYGFSGYDGKYGDYELDTLVLTKPAAVAKREPAEADVLWWKYAEAVARTDADYTPFGFMFRIFR